MLLQHQSLMSSLLFSQFVTSQVYCFCFLVLSKTAKAFLSTVPPFSSKVLVDEISDLRTDTMQSEILRSRGVCMCIIVYKGCCPEINLFFSTELHYPRAAYTTNHTSYENKLFKDSVTDSYKEK
jgi:hypothetical protein